MPKIGYMLLVTDSTFNELLRGLEECNLGDQIETSVHDPRVGVLNMENLKVIKKSDWDRFNSQEGK